MYFRTAAIAAILVLVGQATPTVKRWDTCQDALITLDICTGLAGQALCGCLIPKQGLANIGNAISLCCGGGI